MLSPKAKSIKEWLNAYREAEHYIDNQYERLRRLEARIEGIGAQQLSDLPRPPSISGDRLSEYLIKKEKIEESLRNRIAVQDSMREIIESLSQGLKKVDECTVIQMRYVDGFQWAEIIDAVYGTYSDFTEHRDAYERRTYRALDSALEQMADNWITISSRE